MIGDVAGQRYRLRARLAVWWRAARPFSLTASATPVLVGSAAAFRDTPFHPGLFFAALIASMAIQAATNMMNEYYDYARSVDRPGSPGPSGVILRGQLSPRAVLIGGLALFALAGVLGVLLVIAAGWPILVVGVLSVLVGYAYTGGPWPLGYIGLGDLAVFIFMGPVIVLGAYYVQAHTISRAVLWASAPVAALVTAILVVNNLRDLEDDRRAGKRTLATFLGDRSTRVEFVGLVLGAYLPAAIAMLLRALPLPTVLMFLTAPEAAHLCWGVWRHTDPVLLTGDLRGTARLHQRAGVLLALGFLVG